MAIDSTLKPTLKEIKFQKFHLTEKSVTTTIDSVKNKLSTNGYINNSIDSIVRDKNVYTAYFNLRVKIKKIRIYFTEEQINNDQLSKILKQSTSNYFDVKPSELSKTLQDITNNLEKEGNSFSEVKLKNISIKGDTLVVSYLSIKKTNSRKIDRVVLNGYTNFPKSFLNHELKLSEKSLFNQQKLNAASNTILTIPFASELKPAEVLFTNDSTIIYLNLKKEYSNKFDGLIGFNSNENGKGLVFNGYLDLSLNNLFNFGEQLNVHWKNNGSDRQVFNFDFSLPYIFNSKISPHTTLNIYKQDSTFVNTLFKVSLPYHLNTNNSIGLIFSSESSFNLLSDFNNNINDYSNYFYGFTYNYHNPSKQILFPTKLSFYTEILFGSRKSTFKNNQTKLYLKTNYTFNVTPKSNIFIQNQSGFINSDNLLNNELLRVGGTNSLRGFNEESILTSSYSIINLEYRYTTSNDSYLYSITDYSYTKLNEISSQLYALGLGYAFSSKLGLVNLSYAVGSNTKNPFNLNNSHFHIKFVNFF